MKIELRRSTLTRGQWELLQCRDPFVLFAGGVGSGKTTGIAYKLEQLRHENSGAPGLIAAPSWSLLWSVTYRKILNVIMSSYPRAMWPKVRDRTGECYLDFGRGHQPIFLRSAKHPESLEGFNVGWAIGDEVRYWPRRGYENFIARVRVPCALPQRAFASTPAMGLLSDEFNSGKHNRRLITAPTKENEKNLAPGYLDELRRTYSPRLQRAILDGEFVPLDGAVFDAFDASASSPWLVDYSPEDARKGMHKIYMAIDPGYRRGAWLFIAETGPGQWVVFDQIMSDSQSELATVEIVNSRNYPIDELWVDPAGDATQSAIGIDVFAALRNVKSRNSSGRILRSIGGKGSAMFRDIAFGVDKLRVLLGGYDGKPVQIKFARRLLEMERGKQRGIVKDLGALAYPEMRDGRPVGDHPVKDGITDHSTDALRYFAVGRWLADPELRASLQRVHGSMQSPGYIAA
jgi:hypothetical protein